MNYIRPDWPAPATIHAYTSTRLGWGLTSPLQADQLIGSSESKQLQTLLQLPGEPVWLKQTHGTEVVEAISSNRGKSADASFSSHPNQVCLVQTADCLPILICNQQGTHVAAIHAGWRGLAAGIIEKTLASLGQPGSQLMAWLGPAIGPNHYEVGEDVFSVFTQSDPAALSSFTPCQPGKWLCNLYSLARLRLQRQDITAIYGGDYCTYQQSEWFYSYRRDKGLIERMASVIWIENQRHQP